ncbi:MAG: hypothetical protein EHM61_26355 [Acidobacteria bacterium]|nr:MAG: hypothetical protein EHM61_26355 [Acidobacteriota bacterium]
MRTPIFVAQLVVLACSTTPLLPDVVPGRWEKVDSLKPGDEIVLELQSGEKAEVVFVSSNPEAVVLGTDSGKRRTITKSEIVRVSRVVKTRQRELLGLGIGAGAGVATGLAISSRFDETFFARRDLMALSCGGIGALTGYLIGRGASRPEHEEILFRRAGSPDVK